MYQAYPIAMRQPGERFEYFRGVADHVFCPMHIETSRAVRGDFHACLDAVDLGSVQLVRVSTSPLLVQRRICDIARIPDPPYLVKFQRRGESLWTQRGRQVHVWPGDFVICSTAEPYSLCFRGDYEMPVLVVPQSIMRRLTPDPDQFLGMRMSGEEADCGLLSSFVAQVVARMSRLPEPIIRRAEANVLDLLGAVLNVRARRGTLTRAQQLAQMQAYVRDHLQDRRLGPKLIATAFGVSTRYVHAIFETEGITLGRFIRTLRVAACRSSLEAPGAERVSLTDVALSWGFYDLSHMTRCFREAYGAPPRRFLRQSRDDGSR